MNRHLKILSALVTGVVLGWAMGFYRLPFVDRNDAFFIGFFAGIAFIMSISLFLTLKFRKVTSKIWPIISIFILFGGLSSGLWVFFENTQIGKQIDALESDFKEHTAEINETRVKELSCLIDDAVRDMKIELSIDSNRRLSDNTIQKLAAISQLLKPYEQDFFDTTGHSICSPERGRLFIELCFSSMDSSTFNQVKRKVTFAYADLRGINLNSKDLSGVDFERANLANTQLQNVNLTGANLKEANIWGAKLTGSKLLKCDLTRANMAWVEMENAELTGANLNGINLKNAKLGNSTFIGASIQWAFLQSAVMENCNLHSADLKGTKMNRTNLNKSNLSDANLTLATIAEGSLVGVDLENTRVMESNWVRLQSELRVTGADLIQSIYIEIPDSSGRAKFRLESI